MVVQQSQEYIQQTEAEIDRLRQLLNQVRAAIQSEKQLERTEPKGYAPRKQAVKKSAAKKKALLAVEPKKRCRPKKSTQPTEA